MNFHANEIFNQTLNIEICFYYFFFFQVLLFKNHQKAILPAFNKFRMCDFTKVELITSKVTSNNLNL